MLIAGFRRPTFSCFVEPSEHVSRPKARMLHVHPRFWLQPGPSIPLELFLRVGSRDRFLSGYPLAWVEHPPSGALTPFWIPREWCRTLLQFRQGEPAPSVGPEVAAALIDAGILVDPDTFKTRMSGECARIDRAREQFRDSSYANLGDGLHPREIHALAHYYNELAKLAEPIGDAQCPRRFGWHNEDLSGFVHRQLQPLAERLANQPLTASYTYFAGYREGAVLARHTDREQCEITLSLLLRYEPDSDGTSPWPLCLETPSGPVAIHQRIGDVLAFRGRVLPHWRPALPCGHSSDSLLLHYVARDFIGPLQ